MPYHQEEKIEYRDENGNLLDEEQVRAMEGKVSFSTRYETRTRLVDEDGNEVYDGLVGEEEGMGEGVQGTKAEGVDQETKGEVGEGEASTRPGVPSGVGEDVEKERLVEEATATASPEGEVGKETGKDEL